MRKKERVYLRLALWRKNQADLQDLTCRQALEAVSTPPWQALDSVAEQPYPAGFAPFSFVSSKPPVPPVAPDPCSSGTRALVRLSKPPKALACVSNPPQAQAQQDSSDGTTLQSKLWVAHENASERKRRIRTRTKENG